MSHRLSWFIPCLLLALILTACRDAAVQGQPTAFPTLTPTPRSTPLPAVATAIPPGQEGNPLRMVVLPLGSAVDARNAAPDVEAALLEQAGLVVQVELVERYGEALAALCDSSAGSASVAWLNGLAYIAANDQNCGMPLLQVERGARSDRRTGAATSIIVSADAGFSTLGALNGRSFCRLGYDDFYSWLAPTLLLRAQNIDPLTDLESVTDYDDIPSLVEAVASGDCDAAGIPDDALDRFEDDLGDTADEVEVLTTSVEFPYAILMIPLEVPLGIRLALNEGLLELSRDSSTAVSLRALLGQNALLPATTEDFTELADFMGRTGLDFAQLGN